MTATSSPRSREETPPPPPALLAPVISQDVNPEARLVVMCCLPIVSLESAAAAAAGVAAAAAAVDALVRTILLGPLGSMPRPRNEFADGMAASRTDTTMHMHRLFFPLIFFPLRLGVIHNLFFHEPAGFPLCDCGGTTCGIQHC